MVLAPASIALFSVRVVNVQRPSAARDPTPPMIAAARVGTDNWVEGRVSRCTTSNADPIALDDLAIVFDHREASCRATPPGCATFGAGALLVAPSY